MPLCGVSACVACPCLLKINHDVTCVLLRLQMLIRGSNAVGYTSYPDNVVTEFVRLAAENGIDVFRVFDCFNDVEQMRVCIKAVRDAGKVAEVRTQFILARRTQPVTVFFASYHFSPRVWKQ